MSALRKFASIATASDGRQVLFYVEPDGEGVIMHQVAQFDGGQIDLKLSLVNLSDEQEQAVYGLVDTFGMERADKALAEIERQLGGVKA